MIKLPLLPAPFREHPVFDDERENPHEFDIVPSPDIPGNFFIDGAFNLQLYCDALLVKLFSVKRSKIKAFIQYQCSRVFEPSSWLNSLEKLIDLNRETLTTKDHQFKLVKILAVIETERALLEIKQLIPPQKTYCFEKLKQKLKAYETTEEKLSCLLEAKIEYLQNKPKFLDTTEVPFDEKCDLEIELLKSKKRLQNKSPLRQESPLGDFSKPNHSLQKVLPDKLQINCNLNQFIDIFYQLMYEKQVNGKPFLSGSPNDLAEGLCLLFKDKNGCDISPDTIKTILKPSRLEKRPKAQSRVFLD